MWDLKELENKRKLLKKELKDETDVEKRKIIVSSLLSLNLMLNTSEVKKIYIYNALNILTLNKFKLLKERQYNKVANGLFSYINVKYNTNDLIHIYQVLKNIMNNVNIDNTYYPEFEPAELSDNDLINIAKDFYKNLDENLYQTSLNILNDKKHLQFSKLVGRDSYGKTIYDYYFNDVYIDIKRRYTYMDIITIVHELVHAIQYAYNDVLFYDKFPIASEIEAKVIEYLMIDYLIENEFDLVECEKIKAINYNKTHYNAHMALNRMYEIDKTEFIDRGLAFTYNMMHAYSNVVAKYIYDEIKKDKEKGLNKLKYLMTNPVLLSDKVDFSVIGLDRKKAEEVATEYNQEYFKSKTINKIY